MMEEIKPKKERKFLKAMGDIALTLFRELVLGIGKKVINKVGNKRQGLVITFVILASTFAIAQFPNTLNKQRLGFQTTADGLVWRGSISDTASIQPINNQNAWVILDTVNLKMYSFDFTSNVWNLVGGGGSAFTQPVDSLFFNTGVPTNNVDTAKMRWDSDLATVVLGLNDNVPNELGFKNFWLVKNQTGSTITKGSLVYANGTVGASGRITVAKFIANGSIDAKYLLGITAHDLTDGEDGYVISFGKIRQVNTDTFAAGAILYPSPTVAGVWTDVEPVAPNIDMPIGFCINSSVNNGTIAIRVASGYKLSELHDVAISSPIEKASLYYSGGLWRDTTAALLVSDTASMLAPYFRDVDTVTLSNRINAKLNISDTTNMLVPYLRKADTTSMLLPYFRDADTTSLNLTSRFNTKLNLSDTASMLTNYLRTGTAASTYLPLTGGTLTGTINRQEGSHNGSTSTFYYNILNYFARQDNIKYNPTAQISFTDRPGTLTFPNNVRTSDIYLMTARNWNGTSLGQYLDTTLSVVANQDGGRIGISKLNPDYKLDVNGTFNASGNSLIGGTLGVTGDLQIGNNLGRSQYQILSLGGNAINEYGWQIARSPQSGGVINDGMYIYNLKNNSVPFVISLTDNIGIGTTNPLSKLEVHGSAVFNEGSSDADFRVESDGNAHMVFVDASTDRVGIGTNSPTKTLDVNGELNVLSAGTFGGRLNTNWMERTYSNSTATSLTVSVNTTWLKLENNSTITLTLPNAATYPGKELHIKNAGTGAVNSLSSNIEPLNSTTIGTAILASGGGKWATLVSDGTYWVIMAGN